MTKWKMCLRARLVVMVTILLAMTIANTTMADEAADSNDEVTETEADATATVDEEAPPEGFRNTKWGMSKSEVTGTLSTEKLKWSKKQNALHFKDKIMKGKYDIWLYFCEDEGLCKVEWADIPRVNMSKAFGVSGTPALKNQSYDIVASALDRYEELLPVFVEKFGPGQESERSVYSTQDRVRSISECRGHIATKWSMGETEITLKVKAERCFMGTPLLGAIVEYRCKNCSIPESKNDKKRSEASEKI